MKDVARQFTPVIPAKHTNLRAAASASRDPATPTGAIRTDRDYWIPAFAGMTGVCSRATHATNSGRFNESFHRCPARPRESGDPENKIFDSVHGSGFPLEPAPAQAGAGTTGATHETQSILPPENLRPGTVRKYPTACPPSAPSTLPVV